MESAADALSLEGIEEAGEAGASGVAVGTGYLLNVAEGRQCL